MPSVTINIAKPGAALSDGDKSSVGHMWYELTDDSGTSTSYGFAPDEEHHGKPFAPGQVYKDDSAHYTERAYARTLEITQDQFDAMKAFGDNPPAGGFDMKYSGLSNSCIDFTWKALEKGGLNPTGFEGNLMPTWNIDAVSKITNPFTAALSPMGAAAGRPAARLTDPTMHGTPLTPGTGSPNVLIGYLPAWRALPAAAAAAFQSAQSAADTAVKTAEAATVAAAGTPGAPAAYAAEQATKAAAAASMATMMAGLLGSAAASTGGKGMPDTHVCPVPTPVPPHGPGYVIDGSATVLVNGLPLSRQLDTVLEALGGPDKIMKGELTVLVGG